MSNIPNFAKVKVTIPRLGIIDLKPWQFWTDSTNIKNCLNTAAALYICTLYLYKNEANSEGLPQLPKLFNIEKEGLQWEDMDFQLLIN